MQSEEGKWVSAKGSGQITVGVSKLTAREKFRIDRIPETLPASISSSTEVVGQAEQKVQNPSQLSKLHHYNAAISKGRAVNVRECLLSANV